PVAVLAEPITAKSVELRHDAENRIADALGLRLELVHVDLADVAVAHDLVRGFARNDAEPPLDERERALHGEILRRAVFVRPYAAHRLGREDVAEDVGIDDGSGHGS